VAAAAAAAGRAGQLILRVSLAAKAAASAVVEKLGVMGIRMMAAGGRVMEELSRQAACMAPVIM
jgi:hypothetical protein